MSYVVYRDVHQHYPVIVKGSGIDLWDATGRRYLDGASGALAANLGHGRRDIAEAMARQAERVAFAHTLRFTNAPLEDLAVRVDRLLYDGQHWYTYPTSGGSEAVETAIKLARHIQLLRGQPQRFRVLTFRPSYHGNSLGALSASGDPERQAPYTPLLSPAFVQAPPVAAACPGVSGSGTCPCLAAVQATLDAWGADTFAAVLFEPVTGSARSGFVPHPGFVAGLRQLAHAQGLLVMADEVMTGFGRTGRVLGSDHHGVRPDLLTAAKGLSGGYAPIGAVILSAPIYDELQQSSKPFVHGFTYSGNPVSAAASAKALEIVEQEELVARAERMGRLLADGLQEIAREVPMIETVRGRGLMQGLVLRPEPGLAARVVREAWNQGLILYLGHGEAEGGDGEHLLVGPPLVIDEAGVARLLDLLRTTLRMVAADL
jgi:adenosylmethionine-8-amino-7-oxononanoate aminotransferase